MNFSLYGYEGQWIAVDCGMMIRQDLTETPLQVPNPDTLDDLNIRPEALVITHGHEDHIGAIAWLWPRWGCPIHATPLAAALLRAKFNDHGLTTDSIHVIDPGDACEQGPFTIRFLPVTHSIPESCALLIVTPEQRVLHTGDWKLDADPVIGSPPDEAMFRALAPVDLVVGDSTNAATTPSTRSEGDVARALERRLAECRGRIIISCFASNLARVLAIGRAAEQCGRRISLMGRSMERMVGIARGLGYLDDFPPTVPVHDLGYLPPEEVLVIATGSQGEPRSALSRLARNQHPNFELIPGDSVIFSAKAIPGNEPLIERLQQGLKQLGVVIYDGENHPELHASGHPGRDEITTLYRWIQPRYLLPVHGERPHQKAHQALAKALDIQAPLTPSNGDLIRFSARELTHEASHPQHPCIIDRNRITPLPELFNAESGDHDRFGTLFLAISVMPNGHGWCRIGLPLIESQMTAALDETALIAWLDDHLPSLASHHIAQLRQALRPLLMEYLTTHMRHLPSVHLQLIAA
ncbi:ribonuclease J [Aidingimonas lacisalsi]|uniref:ribonuclease J n=1 Tax=Aidingimonas lacisalsi TaxID=2604086 RepID=UPI0011D28578|nr:ribonuclease J [Aidingimonas lacisalsi]